MLTGILLILIIAILLYHIYDAKNQKLRYLALRKIESDKLEKLVHSQVEGGKLLIRRDLKLTRMNEELEKLQQLKSEFVTVVAHQLRTPLSAIKWSVDMVIKGDVGEITNDQKALLLKAYESNDRMIILVNDMLNADRLESGKFKYSFIKIQLNDLIDNVLYELLPQLKSKNITIQFTNRQDSLPQVLADPEKIRAVLQNILENAVKYTPANGSITIELAVENEKAVRVSITDSGIGIPQSQQNKIYNRFFRGSNAVKTVTDGTGLGLYIAKSIVEKHGGKTWFESEENKGTKFYFTLPITQ